MFDVESLVRMSTKAAQLVMNLIFRKIRYAITTVSLYCIGFTLKSHDLFIFVLNLYVVHKENGDHNGNKSSYKILFVLTYDVDWCSFIMETWWFFVILNSV